jgi:hypothetical protein
MDMRSVVCGREYVCCLRFRSVVNRQKQLDTLRGWRRDTGFGDDIDIIGACLAHCPTFTGLTRLFIN